MGAIAGWDYPNEEVVDTEERDFWEDYTAEERFEKRREEKRGIRSDAQGDKVVILVKKTNIMVHLHTFILKSLSLPFFREINDAL